MSSSVFKSVPLTLFIMLVLKNWKIMIIKGFCPNNIGIFDLEYDEIAVMILDND